MGGYRKNAMPDDTDKEPKETPHLGWWFVLGALLSGMLGSYIQMRIWQRMHDMPPQCTDLILPTNSVFDHHCDGDQSAERADYGAIICRCKPHEKR